MVAIVSGNNLGLNLSSLASIGPGGQFGKASLGQTGERSYVDVSTGNLVVQGVDTALVGLGGGTTTLRTYNSQGVFDQDNGDGWRGAPYRSVIQHGQGPVVRTDIDGSQTDFLWDAARGAYVAQVAAGQALDTIVADANGNWVFTDGSTGGVEVYQGTGQGLILSQADTSGNSFTYSYIGNLLSRVQGSDGDAVDYTYSGGNLTQVSTTLADGTLVNQVSYTYDTLNRLQSVSVLLDQSGDVPAGAESGASYTTSYTYDANSTRLASITQSDGTTLSFTYVGEPGVWRIATVTDGEGKTTAFSYNVAGGSTTVTDPTGVSSVYQYDTKGQLTAVRTGVTPANANGLSQMAYRYDSLGNVQSVTDGLGRSVTFSYDANANQVGQVDALGNRLERTFDAHNQLLSETVYPQADQPRTTRYVYDAAGRNLLRFVVSAEGRVTEYQYNASGLRTAAIVYAAGTYPVAGLASGASPAETQVQAWAAAQDLGQTERTELAYDYRGQLRSSTTYAEVDALGQGVAATASTTHYVYDAKGQLLQTLSPSGAGETHLVYDGLGRQVVSSSRATDGSIDITTLTQYDDAHNRATVRLANGLATVSVYDHAGRIVSVSQDAGDPALGTTRYAYDPDGNLAMTQDATGQRSWMLYDGAGRKVADIGPDGQLTEYIYDRANRLTETIAYAHKVDVASLVDGAGAPLTQWNANPASAPAGTTPVTLASLRQPSAQDQKSWNFYDADSRLCFQVDALGHVTQTQYDGASRVSSVTRLALPVDVSALGDGVNLELLLGGRITTTQLTETIQPGGPNAPRILTAQVAGQGTQPTGLVSFYVQDTLLGTAAVVNGVATLVVSNLPAGSDALSAVYGGDADNLGSTSNVVVDTVAPAYAAVTTLSASTASAEAGTSIRLTANVAGLNPGGIVIFYSGTRAIGVASLVNGTAVLDVNSLGLGSNVLTAVYQGDAQNARSASAAVTEVVTQASSATAATVTTLLVSDARSLPGQPVTLTAQVSGATPSGTVDFFNGAQLLGTATLANGLASLVVASLPVGVDSLTARYAGDAANTTSASAPLGIVVLQPTTLSVSGPTSVELGAPATLSASITGAAPGGVVSFYRGTTLLGSAQVSGGTASVSVSSLPLGVSGITALYSGDGANVSSTSAVRNITVVPAHTTTSLAVSASTVAAGANLTLTATVSGTGQPNGPVNFYNNGTLLGSANVVDGVATLVVDTLPVGTARLSASYTGDSGNVASASGTTRITVTTADVTQTTLAVSASNVVVGSALTLTASIAAAGAPGGTVTFYNGAAAIGTVAVSGGQAALTLSSLPVGTANLSAVYSGDASHGTSSAGAVTVTVAAATTQLALASSVPSSAFGAPLTLTANVGGGFNAAGTVTFFNGQAVLGTATVVNGQASLAIDTLPVGALALQASYSGDANNASSVASLSQTITPAPTTTSLSASQSTARQGSAVVLTAQVAGTAKSQPGGVVTFYNGATVLGTATVTNGLAAISVSGLPVGGNAITASYAGDARTAASSSAALVETITAAPQATTTTLSASSANVQQGETFTLTATVAGSSPSGLVTFLNGQTVLGTATVDATGTARLTTALAAKGTFALTATYAGDAGNATSVSAAASVKVTPGAAPATPPAPPATTTTLTASAPSAVRGNPVTLFVRVDRSVAGAVPGGTVSFFNGTTLIGSATLASAQAALTLTNLPVGTDSLRAVYSGDASSATSISSVLTETISLATSTVNVTASAASITQGSGITLTARVAGNVAPTGTVTFYSGATVLGTASVVSGLASQTFTSLPLGNDAITARYSGDGNNAVATSGSTTVVVTSAPATSTVSLSTSPRSVQLGQPVTLNATVRGSGATGTVSFFNGGLLLGSAAVQGGSATLSVSSLPLGNASLVAVYSGDAGNAASTSAVASETVTVAGTSTTLSVSSTSSAYGSPVVLMATVSGTGNPSGAVNFYSGATLLGTATLSNGVATLSVSNLEVGTDTLSAAYAGDTGHAASTSAAVTELVSTAVSSLSVLSAAAVAPNGDITVRVNGVNPGGTVVFLSGQTVLGTAVVTGGVATLQGTRLPLGSYTLTAAYSGDGHNAPSALDFNQGIVAATTTTTLASASPYVAQNAPLVLTAHVAGSHPGGTVTFYSGSTAIGTATLVNGLAALTVDSLDDGTAALTAVYSGDANNTASMSAVLAEQVVTAPVNIGVASSAASVKQGEPLTLTATVTGDHPAGSVAFVAGKITLGSAALVNGVATLLLPSVDLSAGVRDIVAVYMGDGHNAATSSQALQQNVATGITHLRVAADPQDRTVTRIEDRDGRLRATVDAEGYLTELRYNAAGRLVQTVRYALPVSGFVDAASIAARVAQARATGSLVGLLPGASSDDIHSYVYYNARGQKVGEVDGERYLTEFVYDTNGNLTQQIRYATPVAGALPGRLTDVRPQPTPQDSHVFNTWDALDRLATQTNAEGTVTAYTYDDIGRMVRTDVALNTADQRTLTVRYDVQGRVVAELSPQGAALLTGNLTQGEIDAVWDAYAVHHTYDAVGRLTSTTDANGNRTVFLYDDAGRLRFTVNALGEVQERRYGALGRLEQTVSHAATVDAVALQGGLVSAQSAAAQTALAGLATAANQSTNTFHYDVVGRMVESFDAENARTTYGYNAFDELARRTQSVDGQDRVGTLRYDRRGLQVESDAFLAGVALVTTSEYDAFGRRIRMQDANGNLHQQSFDRLGRVVQTIDPLNALRSTSYDAFDRVLTQTDALGHSTSYSWDRAQRSVTVTTPEGVTMTTVHNRERQTQSVTDGNGNTTTYSYDANGNVVRTDTPLTHSSAEYDKANRLMRTTDANGVAVDYEYDAANRLLTRTLDPSGLALSTHYGYDAKGRQVTMTDPRGTVTAIGYDLNGRVLTQTVDPAGLALTTSYTYNEAGDVLTVTSPGGTVTKYVYDELGRRKEEHLDPSGLDLVCRYDYDAKGNLLRKIDANGHATLYAYDTDDRLVYVVDATGGVRETRYDAEGRAVGSTAYATRIDLSGAPASLTAAQVQALLQPSAQDVVQDAVLDKDGQVEYTVDGAGGVTRFWHDGNGNVVRQVAYANAIDRAGWVPGTAPAVAASAADREIRTAYDALNRVHWVCDGGDVSRLEYDANGNVLLQVRYAQAVDVSMWDANAPSVAAQPQHDEVTHLVYDAANRALFQVDGVGALTAFKYDADGNVVDRTAFAHTLPAGTPLTAAGLDAAAAALADAGHDAHIRRVYDAANRLTWSVDGVGAVTHQVFDRNGNLVQQVAYAQAIGAADAPDSVVAGAGDRVTLMAYDAVNQKTWQVDAMGGVTRRIYDAAGNLVALTAYGTRIGAPAASTDPATVPTLVQGLAFTADDRTVRAVFDSANRQVYTVDPAGSVTQTVYDGAGRAVASIAYARTVNAAALPLQASAADVQPLADAADRQTVRAFDGAGRQVYAVDGLGYVSHTEYDGLGRVTRQTLHATSISGAASPSLALAGRADLIAAQLQASAQDRSDSFAYDAAGHLASSTDAAGASESYTYDGLGNRLSYTNKKNAVWTYDYDAAGRLLTETSAAVALGESQVPTQIVTRLQYDALGNLLARTEAYGLLGQERTTRYEYDALGRQVKTTFPHVDVYDTSDDIAANGADGLAVRKEVGRDLTTQVTYDVFGDAIANKDVGDAYSYKAYDKLGRVTQEIDALGQVTAYERNAFGDAATVTRYAQALSLPAGAANPQQIASALAALGSAGARAVHTEYNQRGQAVRVTEPEVWVHPGPGQAGYYAAKVTRNVYNAFGELEQTGVQADAQTFLATTNRYDQRGQLVASIDAGGYLTTQAYDAAGNVIRRTEFANKLAAGAQQAAASADDRTIEYTYDLLNRVTALTRLNVVHSNDGLSVSASALTTGYAYDAVGNLLSTTDALGGVTSSEYDALGRVTRVLAPERDGIRPMTEFYRDAYGNVLLQREVGAAGAATRDTRAVYDSHGHVTQVTDAEGYEHFMSYDSYGHLAKQWQAVAGNDHQAHTLYTVFRYDALGQQTDVVTPGTNSVLSGGAVVTINQASAGVVHSRMVYNAFGEMVQRGTYRDGEEQLDERFDYDAAGRLFRSNAGDGSWKVMLYDVQGFQTAQIASAGGASGADLAIVTDAQAADGLTVGVRRTDAKVDELGRTLEQHLPQRYDSLTGQTLSPVVVQTFDRWGNVLSQNDPANGAVTQFRYDANNQVVARIQPGNITTEVRYDALGRQTAIVDANGNVNRQVWDSAGNLVRELHADGGVVQYHYDVFNERDRMVDAEGNQTSYAYDKLGRLKEVRGDTVTIASADEHFNLSTTSGTLATTYTYDAAGRKLTQTNGAGETIQYTYDLRGNVTATTQPMGETSRAAFDVMDRQVATQDANGGVSTWRYDHFGQLQGHQDLGGAEHFYFYDTARQLTQQTSTRGQDMRYAYDAAGQLVGIDDRAIEQQTSYAFDGAGRRTLEQTVQAGMVYQQNILGYDALGRLNDIRALDDFHIRIDYDAVGNKIHQHVEGHGLARSVEGTQQVQTGIDEGGAPVYSQTRASTTVFDATTQELWFAYDKMNRQVLVDGVNNNTDLSAANINSAQGHVLRYDRNGNRIQDTFWGKQVVAQQVLSFDESGNQVVPPEGVTLLQYASRPGVVTEYYGYDRMNRVASVSTDSQYDLDLNPIGQVVLDRRYYDAAGRMVQNGPAGTLSNDYIKALSDASEANGASTRVNRYNADGRLMAQHVAKPDGTLSYDTIYEGTVNSEVQVQTGNDENGDPVFTTQIITQTGPGYDAAGNILGYRVTDGSGVTSSYNMTLAKFEGYKEGTVSGFRSDNPGQPRTTTNQYDANGNLVGITDDTGSETAHRTFVNDVNGMVLQKNQQGNVLKQLIVGGELYASYGLAEDPQNPGSYLQQAQFDTNYQPITNLYPSAGTGAYTVRSGDTLRVIAQAAYGDAELWYVIADANGLHGDADLRVGQTLDIPTKVGSIHNNASTFKPYDPSKVIGDTTPELPVPQSDDDDCGGFGEIIMIVVAAVAAYFTAGAALALMGTTAATASAGALVVAGAVGGAAGSIASQLVGNALGIVDGFSWKAVAMAAIGGAVGGGMQAVAGGTGALSGSGFGATVLRGAIGNALTQGIAVATGLQDHFSWKGVAAAAVGAGVGWGVDMALGGDKLAPNQAGPVRPAAFSELGRAGDVIRGTLSGFASGLASAAVRGGRIDVGQIATDAFGNALGQSIVSEIQRSSQSAGAGLNSRKMQLQTLDNLAARPGTTPEQLEAIQKLRDEVAAGQHDLSVRTVEDLKDDKGRAANARFNSATGEIEVNGALVRGADTREGAAGLLGAVLEEHGEWAASKLGIQFRNASGAAVDTGAVLGMLAMGGLGAQLAAAGQQSLDYSLTINGDSRTFTTDSASIYQATLRLFTPDRILMNVTDKSGAYQSTTLTSAINQISAKLRTGAVNLGNDVATVGGFVFGVGEQAVTMVKGLGQLAIDAHLSSLYLIGKATGIPDDYLPAALGESYGRMQGLYNAAANFVKLPVGQMLSKVFLDPVVNTWNAANDAYAKASATQGFAPQEWFDYGRALGAFSTNLALAVTGAGGLIKAGYSLARFAAGGLENALTGIAANLAEGEAALTTTTRGTVSLLGREFQVLHRFQNGGVLVKTGDQVWHVPNGMSLADVPVADTVGNALQRAVNEVTPGYSRQLLRPGERQAILRAEAAGEFEKAASLEKMYKGWWVQNETEALLARTQPDIARSVTFSQQGQGVIDVVGRNGMAYDIHTNVLNTIVQHGRTYSTQLFRAITY